MQHFFDSNFHIQLIGFLAITISFAVFQVNHRPKMLLLQTCAALIWTLHFLLLGAHAGAAMNLVTAFRNYTFYKAGKNRARYIPLSIIGLFGLADILAWQGSHSLLPLVGSVIGTLAFWQIKTHLIRFIALFGPLCWFAYNVTTSHSYAGMTADIITFSSILIGIYRFDIRPAPKRRPAYQKLHS